MTELYRAHIDAVSQMLRLGWTFTSRGRTVTFRGYRDPSQLDVAIQEGFVHAFRARGRETYDETKEYRPFLPWQGPACRASL
ncbi:MAG: hypothetical protein AAGI01_00935 [Myxococcota bacterium]